MTKERQMVLVTYKLTTLPVSEHVIPVQVQTGDEEFHPSILLATEYSSQLDIEAGKVYKSSPDAPENKHKGQHNKILSSPEKSCLVAMHRLNASK